MRALDTAQRRAAAGEAGAADSTFCRAGFAGRDTAFAFIHRTPHARFRSRPETRLGSAA